MSTHDDDLTTYRTDSGTMRTNGFEEMTAQFQYKNTFLHIGSSTADDIRGLRRIATCPLSVYDESASLGSDSIDYAKMEIKPQMRRLEASWAKMKVRRSLESHESGKGKSPLKRELQTSCRTTSYSSQGSYGSAKGGNEKNHQQHQQHQQHDEGKGMESSAPSASRGQNGSSRNTPASGGLASHRRIAVKNQKYVVSPGRSNTLSRGNNDWGGSGARNNASTTLRGKNDGGGDHGADGRVFEGFKGFHHQSSSKDKGKGGKEKGGKKEYHQHEGIGGGPRRNSQHARGNAGYVSAQEPKRSSGGSGRREKGSGKSGRKGPFVPVHFARSEKAPKTVYIDLSLLEPKAPQGSLTRIENL